jgi:hypothetical protein
MQAKTVVQCLDATAPFLYLAEDLPPQEFEQYVKWITFAGRRISEGEIRNLEELKKEFVEHMYTEYKQDIDIDFL